MRKLPNFCSVANHRFFVESRYQSCKRGGLRQISKPNLDSFMTDRELPNEALSPTPCPRQLSAERQLLWMLAPIALALLGYAAIYVDHPISFWCYKDNGLKPIQEFLNTMETPGNGYGVFILGVTIFCLDHKRRILLVRALCCAFGAGLTANGLKLLLERTRPKAFDFTNSIWESFGGWLPGASAGSSGQSFPSAHTATAFCLAVVLCWMYPRGRCLFPFFAFCVAWQRIASGAHFLSDTLFGAATGCFIALLFFKIGLLPGWLDSMETRFLRKHD